MSGSLILLLTLASINRYMVVYNTFGLLFLLQSNNKTAAMAPSMHPPCVSSPSCQSNRCHPRPPICKTPERCLRKTTSKGTKPCPSAASIMATRARSECTECGRMKRRRLDSERERTEHVKKYLRRKRREAKMRRSDALKGTHSYLKYTRTLGSRKSDNLCCAGHGHRGRLKRRGWTCWCALL